LLNKFIISNIKHMKKKELMKSLKVIALAVLLSGGIAFADVTWNEPDCAPPNCNPDTPVNVGTTPQSKAGDLNIMGEDWEYGGGIGALDGMLYTELFISGGPAAFLISVDVGDAESNPDGLLRTTGKLGVNLDEGIDTDEYNYVLGIPTKELDVNGDARIRGIGTPTGGVDILEKGQALGCVETNGTFFRCTIDDIMPPAPSNYETHIITVNSGDILFYQGWKSCPATHPHPIGGGGKCYVDGIGEAKMIESQPSRGSVTHWTNLDEPDELPYSWWVKCDDSADIVTVYAICSD